MRSTQRPAPDQLLQKIADYVLSYDAFSQEALETARYCLFDTLGCGLLALDYPACTKVLGPIVPGAELKGGARVPGTAFELDPVRAAFNIGAMIRWLDFNDTWLAAEWGHPSDNLGGILAVSDYLSRQNIQAGKAALSMRTVLHAMIKAHEIQGVLALENSFNRVGLDHVLLVRVATTAVVTGLLGGSREQIIDAVSNAFVDGGALRAYRHAPNTGSRKSWAAGDATSRGVFLSLQAMRGEMGYPSALSVKTWGFQDVLFNAKEVVLAQPLACYVMENILFKIAYPAEFHAQTAVEVGFQLHAQVKDRLDEIDKIVIQTQEAALRIIDKTGPLNNPADRDHCLQYMLAIALLKGSLTAQDYEDDVAKDPRITQLRDKMRVEENRRFSEEYLHADKRAIGNAVQVFFKNKEHTECVSIDYPLGHRRRRAEGIPLLIDKFINSLEGRVPPENAAALIRLCKGEDAIEALSVDTFQSLCCRLAEG